MCLGCNFKMSRPEMQELIRSHNPSWSAQSAEMAPDADVQLTEEQIEGFKVKLCPLVHLELHRRWVLGEYKNNFSYYSAKNSLRALITIYFFGYKIEFFFF